MLAQGLRTINYYVPDLVKAKAWYSAAFEVLPYFDEPYYVGYNIGGYELGLNPDMENVTVGNSVIAYWGVEDINKAYKSLVEKGATVYQEIQDVGEGILVASVHDPFGNVIGLIENPHFKIE